jgi:hypothetical protein
MFCLCVSNGIAGTVSPSMLHKHSLDLLASHYAHFVTISETELQKLKQALPSDLDNLQVALPSLLVELASPIQVFVKAIYVVK